MARAGSQAFFKAKFLVAYHAIGGLMRLLARRGTGAGMASGARSLIRLLADDEELLWVRRQATLKKLLAEYRIEGVHQDLIIPERPMFGLVEALLPAQTFESVDQLLDRVLARISDALQEVTPD